MQIEHWLKQYSQCESESTIDEFRWLRDLLEYRAKEKDAEIRNQLLKELVLKYASAQKELVRLNKSLIEKQKRLDDDLKAAAGIQETLLPNRSLELDNLKAAWKFLPCQIIGGDIFNVFPLDNDHLALYMVDVSGHGVPSALVTVSVSQVLQPDSRLLRKAIKATPSIYEIMPPRSVLKALDEQYPLERFDMFFTIVYAVLDIREGYLCYAKAGHPSPVLLHSGGDLEVLDKNGPIIGMGSPAPFVEERRELEKGDKVIFYTDGVTEYEDHRGNFFGTERFYAVLNEFGDQPIETILDEVIRSMLEFGGHAEPQDDVSLLGIEFSGAPS